jgi:hypothetical protein
LQQKKYIIQPEGTRGQCDTAGLATPSATKVVGSNPVGILLSPVRKIMEDF